MLTRGCQGSKATIKVVHKTPEDDRMLILGRNISLTGAMLGAGEDTFCRTALYTADKPIQDE